MSQKLMNAIVERRVNAALDILYQYKNNDNSTISLNLDDQFQPNPRCTSVRVTCLYEACRRGHTDVVEELLACGACPNGANTWGMTPLHCAAMDGRLPEVLLLLRHGAHILTTKLLGRTPCHQAAARGHIKVVQSFLDFGFDINEPDEKYRYTLLHHAAKRGQIAMVKMLVGRNASMEIRDINGLTPLDVAQNICERKDLELIFKTAFAPPSSHKRGTDRADFHPGRAEDTKPKEKMSVAMAHCSPEDFDIPESWSMSSTTIPKKRMAASSLDDDDDDDEITKLKQGFKTCSPPQGISVHDLFNKVVTLEKSHKKLEDTVNEMKERSTTCRRCSQAEIQYTVEEATIMVIKIRKNLPEIINRIFAYEHLPYLLQDYSISMDDWERIDSERSEKDKARKLMYKLLGKEERGDITWVSSFMKSLEGLQTKDLAKQIYDTEL